jgi:DNA-binding transcriptional MerR regulator
VSECLYGLVDLIDQFLEADRALAEIGRLIQEIETTNRQIEENEADEEADPLWNHYFLLESQIEEAERRLAVSKARIHELQGKWRSYLSLGRAGSYRELP